MPYTSWRVCPSYGDKNESPWISETLIDHERRGAPPRYSAKESRLTETMFMQLQPLGVQTTPWKQQQLSTLRVDEECNIRGFRQGGVPPCTHRTKGDLSAKGGGNRVAADTRTCLIGTLTGPVPRSDLLRNVHVSDAKESIDLGAESGRRRPASSLKTSRLSRGGIDRHLTPAPSSP